MSRQYVDQDAKWVIERIPMITIDDQIEKEHNWTWIINDKRSHDKQLITIAQHATLKLISSNEAPDPYDICWDTFETDYPEDDWICWGERSSCLSVDSYSDDKD
jgi:hypothetical protein